MLVFLSNISLCECSTFFIFHSQGVHTGIIHIHSIIGSTVCADNSTESAAELQQELERKEKNLFATEKNTSGKLFKISATLLNNVSI